jgi:hypothetical protein
MPLFLDKVPYTGDELRTDGYYYHSRPTVSFPELKIIRVAVFYRDGFCMYFGLQQETSNLTQRIEEELLNEETINWLKSAPNGIGVFQINGQSIEFEVWSRLRRNNIITNSRFGEILNDSSFILRETIDNDKGKTYEENIRFEFKQFSPKPDSTNRFTG